MPQKLDYKDDFELEPNIDLDDLEDLETELAIEMAAEEAEDEEDVLNRIQRNGSLRRAG